MSGFPSKIINLKLENTVPAEFKLKISSLHVVICSSYEFTVLFDY